MLPREGLLSPRSPAMISRSLGSRLTVHGRNISTSCAVSSGVRDDRKTSKLRTSPSISSSGSTSLVVGMFLETLARAERSGETRARTESQHPSRP